MLGQPTLYTASTFNINGVACAIAIEDVGANAVVERWPASGMEADVMFKVPYGSRYTVIKGLLGGLSYGGGIINRLTPLAYPPLNTLYCTAVGDTVGIKPKTNSIGWVEYEYVLMPAHFEVPTYSVVLNGDRQDDASGLTYTTTRFRTSAEVFAPPNGTYLYASGTYSGKPVSESSVGIIRSRVEITMTRHLMPFIPLEDNMNWDGTVNSVPIKLADRTFPVGCLLFMGADIPEAVSDPSTGLHAWNITYSFLGNYSITWNEFMDPGGAWVAIHDGSSNPPFEEVDFTALFGNSF